MLENEKAIIRRWVAAATGDQQAVLDSLQLMSPDMSWTLIGTTPISGTYRGLEAIQSQFQAKAWNGDGRPGSGPQGLDPTYGIQSLDITYMSGLEDGRILALCSSSARGKNGLPYENEYCWIFTIEGGKITSLHEFADTALVEQVMFDKRLVPAEQLS